MSTDVIKRERASARFPAVVREAGLAMKFAGVSLIGFVTDAGLLHILVAAGVAPAGARGISLFCAMQVTFVINGVHVFRCLDRKRWPHQWACYMAANGFGNFCNYWIFVTLVSLHRPLASDPLFAVAAGSFCAWMINFIGARFLVFREAGGVLKVLAGCDDEPGQPTYPRPE
jgi:putative flippase GtrA